MTNILKEDVYLITAENMYPFLKLHIVRNNADERTH